MLIHLIAAPDDAPNPASACRGCDGQLLRDVGVTIVRLVDFPNAQLRSFSWVLAAGLTLLGAALLLL